MKRKKDEKALIRGIEVSQTSLATVPLTYDLDLRTWPR